MKAHDKLKDDYDTEMSSGNAARAEKEEFNVAKIDELEYLKRTLEEELDGTKHKCLKDEEIYK